MIYIDVQMPTNCYDCWIRQNMGCRIANDSGWLNDRRADNCPIQAQEAKPPVIKENSYGWKFYYCPSCGKEFYQNNKFSFCEKCGQAVKW